MKIKSNLTLRRVGKNYMVVEMSDETVNLTNVYTMNETAAWLWEACGTGEFSQEILVKRLCDEYEVSEEQAAADVDHLIKEWVNYGLVD